MHTFLQKRYVAMPLRVVDACVSILPCHPVCTCQPRVAHLRPRPPTPSPEPTAPRCDPSWMPSLAQVEHNMTDAKLELTLPQVVAQIQRQHDRLVVAANAKAKAGGDAETVPPRVIAVENVERLAKEVRRYPCDLTLRRGAQSNLSVARCARASPPRHAPHPSLPLSVLLRRRAAWPRC